MTAFNALLPTWVILGLLLPLSGFLIWGEWKRQYRFRTVRVIAACVMMIMLAGILLRPMYAVEKSSSILLLTPGYDNLKADSLLKVNPDLILKHTPDTSPYKESTVLPSYHELAVIGSNIHFILGQGVPTHALDLIDSRRFSFIPGDSPKGITKLSLPQRILANRRNPIEGTYNNVSEKKWIYLSGPGGKEDSVIVNGSGLKFFSLSFSPRQSGNLLYTFTIKDSIGNSIQENIPLHVREAAPLNILFIQGYPTFEIQYLKNFLSHKNHKLVLRHQLSENNFRYEYANRTAVQVSRLTKNALDQFDVLITDTDALQKLSEAEKSILKESIQSGLGLLTLHNKPLKENTKPADFFPFEITLIKTDTTLITTGSKPVTLPAVPMRVPSTSSVQSVLENKSGVLSGYAYAGAGKIGFQFLQETYRLTLSGDSLGYSNLWSPLIEHIARLQDEASAIKITNRFPWYTDEPLHIEVISSQEKPVLFTDSVRIPLQEDVLIDDIWHATLWGDRPGWHILQTGDATDLAYYISKKDDWKSLSIAGQMTENFSAANKMENLSTEKIAEQREVSPLYFYLLFIVAAGFIWLVPKL